LRSAIALAALISLAMAAEAGAATAMPADAARIESRTLANGLEVVVWPDHDIPNVAMYLWFRVGTRNEYPGITGISHYFEHMMFNGTKTRGPGELDRLMEGSGGRNNAYTNSDVTVYQDWFPRSALELIFDLEADRMRNLNFDPKAVESERGVVYSERRSSVDNDNLGALAEQIQATAYVAHPYQFPTVGWPSDIEGWTIEDLKTYYQRYYAPNNAVVFVVGDVTAAEVFALAEKYMAPVKGQPTPPPVKTREPPQLGERRVKVLRDAQTPLIAMAWHAGSAAERQTRVMEVLMAVLGGGDSSRLHQKLVEQEQAALEVGMQLDQGFDPGLAWIFAVLPPGGDVARTEALIDAELARIARDGPTSAELAKARNQLLAGFWRGLETISGKAQALGTYEVFHGDYRKLFDAPGEYESITAEQVRAAAASVLRSDNRTVGVLEPVPATPQASPVPAAPTEARP
jgi:zinc protease